MHGPNYDLNKQEKRKMEDIEALGKSYKAFLKTWMSINPHLDKLSTNEGNEAAIGILPRRGHPPKTTQREQCAILKQVKRTKW